MLISDEKKFVYIHVPKTGGTSVSAALQRWSLPRNRARSASWLRWVGLPKDHRRFRFEKHGSLASVERVLPPELFRSYFKFSIVRNPWERLVSDYCAVLQDASTRRHARVRRLNGFDEYLRREAPRALRSQFELLADSSGALGLDFVARFESLEQGFRSICQRLGIEAELPHENRHDHGDYRCYYDAAARDFVRARWARDVEAFGYEF